MPAVEGHVPSRGGSWKAPGEGTRPSGLGTRLDHCLLTSAGTFRELGTGDWELGTPAEGHVPSRGDPAQASNLTLETPNFPCAGWGAPGLQNWELGTGNSR